jgi:hypothetical protein
VLQKEGKQGISSGYACTYTEEVTSMTDISYFHNALILVPQFYLSNSMGLSPF